MLIQMNDKISIQTLNDISKKKINELSEIMGAGFFSDPLLMWMIKKHEDRFAVSRDFFKMYIELGIKDGIVDVAYHVTKENKNPIGVAVWFPNDIDATSVYAKTNDVCRNYANNFHHFYKTLSSHYPDKPSYYILAATSVLANYHGLGVGYKLLQYRLEILDHLGISSYLEASTKRSSKGIYKRLGYEFINKPIPFPEGVDVYPMWRDSKLEIVQTI